MAAPRARKAWTALDAGSFAIFPLIASGRLVGTLSVAREKTRPPFAAEDIEIGTAIADGAAAAVENANLYARLQHSAVHDHEVSRALQDAMLTRLRSPVDLRVVARYLTAESAEQVGGDWYDAVMSTDGALTVVVGDVAGHDIAAATVMGQLRNLLRAFIWNDPDENPAGPITRLDQVMRHLDLHTMTTLAVVRIEQTAQDRADGTRTLRWSSGGHPPPVLAEPGGRAAVLRGAPDPPLGIEPTWPRNDHTCRVDAGSTLLLYTDGLLETRALDHDGRLATDEPPDALVDAVLAAMLREQHSDDVALLALRFDPTDAPPLG